MELSRLEYWSELPFPSPGEFPNPGIELDSPALQAEFFTISATRGAIPYTKKYSLFIQNSNFGGKQTMTKSLRGSVRKIGTQMLVPDALGLNSASTPARSTAGLEHIHLKSLCLDFFHL